MAAGAIGRQGNHAAWRVEGVTEDVLAHALIQPQMERKKLPLEKYLHKEL